METEKHTDDGFVLRRRSTSTERNSGSVSDSQTDRQTDTHITVLRSPKHEHFARIYPISRRFKIGLCLRPQNIGVCSLFVEDTFIFYFVWGHGAFVTFMIYLRRV